MSLTQFIPDASADSLAHGIHEPISGYFICKNRIPMPQISEISISISEIIVAILTILTAALGFIIKEQKEKIKNIQNQLSEKKYKVYHEVFAILFDVLKDSKKLIKSKENHLVVRLLDIKRDLIIYAPDNVVQKFFEWNKYVSNNPNDISHISLFFNLIILIRKDMGHRDTKLSSEEILRAIMSNDEEFEKMKVAAFKEKVLVNHS